VLDEAGNPVLDGAGNIKQKFRPEPFNPKANDLAEVSKALKHLDLIDKGALAPPFFLDGGTGDHAGLDPKNLISTQSGILDMTTLREYPATPQFFTRTALPLSYNATALCPQWDKFTTEVLVDPQLVALLQQWFGFLLTTDMTIQRFLYLQGRPRSGKGTCGRVLDALIGPRNIASHTLQDLAGGFGREGVIGKALLKITELSGDKKQLLQGAAFINGITGQDPLHIERKYKGALDIVPAFHIVVMGNGFPDFGDHAAAIGERMDVLPFRKSFYGKENTKLTAELLTELPGILNWALAGLASLNAVGRFLTPPAAEEARIELLDSGNPLRGFIRERCDIGPEFNASKDDLFDAYKLYCQSVSGYVFTRDTFLTKLRITEHSLQDGPRVATDDGSRERLIGGIRLRPAGLPTTLTVVYRLDMSIVEFLGPGPVDASMVSRDANGRAVIVGTAADDFAVG